MTIDTVDQLEENSRKLDFCGVRSLCGECAALEIFGMKIPSVVDVDSYGDLVAVTGIVEERDSQDQKCANCINNPCDEY